MRGLTGIYNAVKIAPGRDENPLWCDFLSPNLHRKLRPVIKKSSGQTVF